jgi:hypothetical protein
LRCIQERSEGGICPAGFQSSCDAAGKDIGGFPFGDGRQSLRKKTGAVAGVLVSGSMVIVGESLLLLKKVTRMMRWKLFSTNSGIFHGIWVRASLKPQL